MAFPQPVVGLVIRYSYLWDDEFRHGLEEGVKDRPCAVVMVVGDAQGQKRITVLPVTHTPPSDPSHAVEIPHATKTRLGLDDNRSWVVLTEANRFIWPGPDLRMKEAGNSSSVAYGLLPASLTKELLRKFGDVIEGRLTRMVSRTE